MRNQVVKLSLFLIASILLSGNAQAFDFTGWDSLLKKYVKPVTLDGVKLNGVDYPALQKDPEYARTIRALETFSPAALKSREQKLAFWINTYNIMAVKMVLDHYPVNSIKDAGGLFSSVWKKDVGKVGGKTVTLNEIEHEILRPMGDPRIHVAIVCASVSCPDLRPEAYTVEALDRQLDDQMRQFLANTSKGLVVKGGEAAVSSIFKWFAEDFESRGDVPGFLTPYAPQSARPALRSGDLDYLDYNWNLNKL